jgi:uncharacterized membrane protein
MNTGFLLLSIGKWNHTIGMVALVAVSLFVPLKVRGQTQEYIVRQLSSDDAAGVPCKLNSLGDVAGRAGDFFSGETRATIWNHSYLKKKKHLGALLGGDYSSASAINDAGQVTGVSNTSEAILPFIWTPTAGLQRVPLLPGDNCGQASGINKHGHVAGYSSGPNECRIVGLVKYGDGNYPANPNSKSDGNPDPDTYSNANSDAHTYCNSNHDTYSDTVTPRLTPTPTDTPTPTPTI